MSTLLITILAALAVTSTAQQCYYPDGSNADADVPCTSDTNTWCCGENTICLTNGYCINVVNEPWTLSAGSCTDATWDAGVCASECIDLGDGSPRSGGQSITFLTADNGKYKYCCGQVISTNDTAACYIGSPFELGDATMISGRAALANYTNAAATASSSSSTTTTVTATTTVQASSSSSSSKEKVAIGAGVGIPLGLIAVASLTWALWERSLRKRSTMPVVATIDPNWSPASVPPPPSELGAQSAVRSPMAELSALHDERPK